MFWLVGSLNGLKWTAVLSVMPLLILALIITMPNNIVMISANMSKGITDKTAVHFNPFNEPTNQNKD
jgi:ABC-type enterobactin transport system permease subunit